MNSDVGEVTKRLENEQSSQLQSQQSSFSNLSVPSPTSLFILQPFRRFTYVRAHSPTLALLRLSHSSFSTPSFASPTSQALHLHHWRAAYITSMAQDLRKFNFCIHILNFSKTELILLTFHHFTYVTTHSPSLRSLYLRHSSFSNPSIVLPTSQLIFQPFRCFTYVTAHFITLPSLYLRHSSFSNPSVASPTSQLILQPFFRFSYVTGSSLTSLGQSSIEKS